MKRQYRLTDAELDSIIQAGRPTPAMWMSGGVPMGSSPQENANRAWKAVAGVHGFIWDSAEPAASGDSRDVLAEPIPPTEPLIDAMAEQAMRGGSK